jgi:putative FmdB family regulatory protein
MPVFDFECLACKKIFTELIFGSEKAECPYCHSHNNRKQISAFHTISQNTKCDWDDPSLPSKEKWQKARSKPVPKQAPARKVKRKKLKRRK